MVVAAADAAARRTLPSPGSNQAKNGLMGGMPATAQTLDAYKRAKAEVPKTLEEAQALLSQVADALGVAGQAQHHADRAAGRDGEADAESVEGRGSRVRGFARVRGFGGSRTGRLAD